MTEPLLRADVGAEPVRGVQVEAVVEQERERDPDDAPGRRLAHAHFVRFLVEHAEVEREHRENKDVESNPKPGVVSHDDGCVEPTY